jgi:hypothetical protein
MAHSVLQRVISRLRPAPIAAPAALKEFLGQRALLIAQKCAIDYCRGKTGLASYALFNERPFLEALDVCRWEAFAAVTADLLVLVEGHLRPHTPQGQHERVRAALVALYGEMLEAQARPAHRAQGWSDAIAAFGPRLEAAGRAVPMEAVAVADHSAKRLFETLPIHSSYRELDEEVVYGAVRFRMIAINQELRRRLSPAGLVGALLA